MKKIFIAFVAVACALSACSDDDTADDLSRATISITPDAIPAGPDGTTTQVTVTSSGDWRLAGVCDWVHPSAEAGKSGDVVTFTIDPNTSEESREATFKFFTGSAVAPLKIVSEAGYSLTLLSEENMTVEALSTDIQVKLHTNIPELAVAFSDGGGDWVTYVGRNDAFGNTVLNFTVAKNPDYDDRSTVVTVSGMGQSVDIPLTQNRIYAINIEDTAFEFDLAERSFSVDVNANVDYKVMISDDWITQVPETRGLETKTLTFHLGAATTSRGGKITIEGAGITKELSVIQKDPNATLISFVDKDFVKWLQQQGWIVALGSTSGIITEKGLAATELSYNPSYYGTQWTSLEGIENFTNLEKINVMSNDLSEIDLSGLTKVKELKCTRNFRLALINLGDNPIESLSPLGTYYSDAEKFTMIGNKLVSLDLTVASYYVWYDGITSIDVSGCPALQTLKCDRGERVKSLYLKKGQDIPHLTKNAATEIVYVD